MVDEKRQDAEAQNEQEEPNFGFMLKGKRFEVEVNIYSIDEVKRLLEVDLLKCFEDNAALMVRLSDEPPLLVNVLFVLCERACETHGFSDIDFGRAFNSGDKFTEAVDCFMAALLHFFPRHQREPYQILMAKAKKAEMEVQKKLVRMANDPKFDEILKRQVDRFDGQFSNALASLESSMLEDEPSGN